MEEMEVSEKRRLAFLVANSYKQSKKLDPLMGTEDSIQNVQQAIQQHGFKVLSISDQLYSFSTTISFSSTGPAE